MGNKSKEIIDIENRIRSPKHDKFKIVALLMLNKTPDEMEYIRNNIASPFRGLLSMSYLKRSKMEDIFQTGYYIEKETSQLYGVLLYLFEYHYKFINDYVILRDRAYDLFLSGKDEEALKVVGEIDKICRSMWAERFKMAILKTIQNKDRYDKYYRGLFEKKLSSKFSYLLRYTSNSQSYNYEDIIKNEKKAYDLLTMGVNNKTLRDFYLSYCCPFADLDTDNWVGVSLNSSIIDIYECMLVNLRHLLESTRNNPEFRKYVFQINNLIKDNMLQRWCYLENIDRSKTNITQTNAILQKKFFSKSYDYKDFLDVGLPYISENPRDVVIQLMLAKCIVHKGDSNSVTVEDGNRSISDIVFMNMVVMFDTDNTKENGIDSLLGACYTLNFILELRSLYYYTLNYKKIFMDHVLDDFWKYSPSVSLYDLKGLKEEERVEYIKTWCNLCDGEYSEVEGYINSIETAELFPLQLGGINVSEISILENYQSKGIIPEYWQSGVSTYIYNEYLRNKKAKEALEYYIYNTINREQVKVVRNPEVEDIISDNCELLEKYPLETSIFRTMTNMSDYDRFDAYLSYLEHIGVKYASELEVSVSDKKMIYFLSNVCDLPVLWQHVDVLKSSNEVFNERIKICKKLLEVCKSKKISNEISEIIQQQKIKSLTRKVDESKIYVDVSGIINRELNTERTLFDIYQNFDMIKDDQSNVLALDDKDENVKGIEVDFEKIRRGIFNKIFLGVRDKFLFDHKFGLDFFLSTRIRHGTLMNQLRHNFEFYHLITNKNADEVYVFDDYWTEKVFKLHYLEKQKAKKILSDFSRTIDDSIIYIKEKCIQIRTEQSDNCENAAFDFTELALSDRIKRSFTDSSGINNFTDFVSVIFGELWEHTSECLEKAKNGLSKHLSNCVMALDTLDNEICGLFPDNKQSDFHNVVMDCKSAIAEDVEVVKNWFQLTNSTDFDFNIKDVYDTSIAFVNNVHQVQLNVKYHIQSESVFIHRSHFIALYDMFSDMFNNTCNYAVRRTHPQKELDAHMDISEDNQNLNIHFSNLVDVEDEPKIIREIEERKANESKYIEQGLSRSDKKTGIVRMMILTQNALGDNSNRIDIQLDDHRFVVSLSINKTPLTV